MTPPREFNFSAGIPSEAVVVDIGTFNYLIVLAVTGAIHELDCSEAYGTLIEIFNPNEDDLEHDHDNQN